MVTHKRWAWDGLISLPIGLCISLCISLLIGLCIGFLIVLFISFLILLFICLLIGLLIGLFIGLLVDPPVSLLLLLLLRLEDPLVITKLMGESVGRQRNRKRASILTYSAKASDFAWGLGSRCGTITFFGSKDSAPLRVLSNVVREALKFMICED